MEELVGLFIVLVWATPNYKLKYSEYFDSRDEHQMSLFQTEHGERTQIYTEGSNDREFLNFNAVIQTLLTDIYNGHLVIEMDQR